MVVRVETARAGGGVRRGRRFIEIVLHLSERDPVPRRGGLQGRRFYQGGASPRQVKSRARRVQQVAGDDVPIGGGNLGMGVGVFRFAARAIEGFVEGAIHLILEIEEGGRCLAANVWVGIGEQAAQKRDAFSVAPSSEQSDRRMPQRVLRLAQDVHQRFN